MEWAVRCGAVRCLLDVAHDFEAIGLGQPLHVLHAHGVREVQVVPAPGRCTW
jgi:hypothetical protein